MSKLKVGDKVTLKREDIYNSGIIGIIEAVRERIDYPYIVKWSNGRLNMFDEIDLELVISPKPKVDFLSIFTEEQKKALTNYINEQIEEKLKKYE